MVLYFINTLLEVEWCECGTVLVPHKKKINKLKSRINLKESIFFSTKVQFSCWFKAVEMPSFALPRKAWLQAASCLVET